MLILRWFGMSTNQGANQSANSALALAKNLIEMIDKGAKVANLVMAKYQNLHAVAAIIIEAKTPVPPPLPGHL